MKEEGMPKSLKGFKLEKEGGMSFIKKIVILLIVVIVLMYFFRREQLFSIWDYISGLF